MIAANYSEFRSKMKDYLDQVEEQRENPNFETRDG